VSSIVRCRRSSPGGPRPGTTGTTPAGCRSVGRSGRARDGKTTYARGEAPEWSKKSLPWDVQISGNMGVQDCGRANVGATSQIPTQPLYRSDAAAGSRYAASCSAAPASVQRAPETLKRPRPAAYGATAGSARGGRSCSPALRPGGGPGAVVVRRGRRRADVGVLPLSWPCLVSRVVVPSSPFFWVSSRIFPFRRHALPLGAKLDRFSQGEPRAGPVAQASA